ALVPHSGASKQGAAMNIQSFVWTIDLNGDGSYSSWEILETVRWVFGIPGNLVLEGRGNILDVSSLLHIQAADATGSSSLNGGVSSSLSLVLWAAALAYVLPLASPTIIRRDKSSEPMRIGSNIVSTARRLEAPGRTSQVSSPQHAHLPVSRSSYSMP